MYQLHINKFPPRPFRIDAGMLRAVVSGDDVLLYSFLRVAFSSQLPTRPQAEEVVRAGGVTLNAELVMKPSQTLGHGDQVVLDCDVVHQVADKRMRSRAAQIVERILHQDDHCAVIEVGVGVGAKELESLLPYFFVCRSRDKGEAGEQPFSPEVVSRCYKAVPGLVVVALTAAARDIQVRHQFHALLHGALDGSLCIQLPLDGKAARTSCDLLRCTPSKSLGAISEVQLTHHGALLRSPPCRPCTCRRRHT